jgi:2'-5' RNA ligase
VDAEKRWGATAGALSSRRRVNAAGRGERIEIWRVVLSGPTDPIRVFFAIDLDARTRRAAAEAMRALQTGPDGDAIRWVREETLHVTLRFLGNIDPAGVGRLADCVRERTATLRPFRLELGGTRLFPSKRRPVAIVLDVGPPERLEELAEAVERGVTAAGFDPEPRPFRAHLTLGRVRGKRFPVVTGSVTAAGESCDVNEAVLFRSELHHSGARYTPIERTPLGDERSPLITETDQLI